MYSKVTTVELNKELHEKLRDLAKRSGMKVKNLVAYAITYGLVKFRVEHAGLLGEEKVGK